MKLFPLAVLVLLPCLALAQTLPAPSPAESRVPLTFTGGHDTYGPDRGRPVILIAAALSVPPEVFRQAFSKVRPAGPGQEPDPDQVRKNKQALMEALGPYGVTDDRLNAVSNYYRYNRSKGELLWRVTPATGFATVRNGAVTAVTITNPGAGYNSVPDVSIPGMPDVKLAATAAYGTDFATNGSIREIKVGRPAGATP